LSRIVHTESAGKERLRLTKSVALAVRELAKQTQPGLEARDLAAFIALALYRISETIDTSVEAWEKRDYWVKADSFRREWAWSGQMAEKMRQAVKIEDWGTVTLISTQVAEKLHKITVPPGHRLGCPWLGAWDELRKR